MKRQDIWLTKETYYQCDQIEQFFLHLVCNLKLQNLPHAVLLLMYSKPLKPLTIINLPKSCMLKSITFLVKYILGDFYIDLSIFIWSHC